ncbi:hypothetical protein TWF696_007543 [Orbilia brochopaga]|uniref:Uncharacterized protein n=1 Tax=Orbilia brochopaga TaxID=3140254 RepID=A0AAV9UP60_9PEZI
MHVYDTYMSGYILMQGVSISSAILKSDKKIRTSGTSPLGLYFGVTASPTNGIFREQHCTLRSAHGASTERLNI